MDGWARLLWLGLLCLPLLAACSGAGLQPDYPPTCKIESACDDSSRWWELWSCDDAESIISCTGQVINASPSPPPECSVHACDVRVLDIAPDWFDLENPGDLCGWGNQCEAMIPELRDVEQF